MVGHQNKIVSYFADGKALLYSYSNGTKLPEDQQIDTTKESIYDLASLSKLFTTLMALDQLGKVSPADH